MNLVANVFGATGATGSELVKKLIEAAEYAEIRVFVRRQVSLNSPKVKIFIVDLSQPQQWQNELIGDVLFLCLGSTIKEVGRKLQAKIDLEYPRTIAKIAIENKISKVCLISAIGANPNSFLFYSRIKGQLEEELKKLSFNKIIIFQPGMLLRQKNKIRIIEKIINSILNTLNKLGLLKKYKPLPVNVLAEKMVNSILNSPSGISIYPLDKIEKLFI